ncbi:MAG: 3-phosphoshikimate 1-carboxyvinyltransferase [candidate division WS1 bacterium]|nr:3-phosphoshikimate 1-carboxyvinyltransferase [candidate division WS1 bacterium]
MSQLLVRPGSPAGPVTLTAPGDKSISHRALILGALAEGDTLIHGLLQAEDCRRTAEALTEMGAEMSAWGTDPFRVYGVGRQGLMTPCCGLDLGNSGTGLRLLMGVIAGQNFSAQLTGDGSLRRRPMDRVAEPLMRMGALVEGGGPRYTPPVKVHGARLQAIHYTSPVASAQVKSAILLAGLNAPGETVVTEPARSRDHTERMLRAFGAQIEVEDLTVRLQGEPTLHGQEVIIPSDFSSAAFFLVAGCLLPSLDLSLKNVLLNPTRAGLLEALGQMGAEIEVSDQREVNAEPVGTLRPHSRCLHSAEIGGEIIPRLIDEVPLLALAATQASGQTVIRDAAELRVKESDRLATTAAALSAMGAEIETTPDGLVVSGPTPLHAAQIDSYGDHRIAMMAGVAGLLASGETLVSGAECIATSFPEFAHTLAQLGAEVEVR